MSHTIELTPAASKPAEPRPVKRSFDKRTTVWIIAMHVGCLAAPFTFTWPAFWTCVALYWVTGGLGVCLCLHRLLTHRSFKVPKPLEYALTIIACLSAQRSPIFWVARHRLHHAKSDTPEDPHSPKYGFWTSHMIWPMLEPRPENENEYYKTYAPDLAADPGHRFIQKTHEIYPLILAAALFLIGGLPFLIWGFFVRTTAVYHGTWLVNSAAHVWGYRNYETADNSRNNWWVAIGSFGEGWHNNHHAYQSMARHGHRWWEYDMTYYTILLLKLFGIATEVRDTLPRRK